jgi:hypothetical protein
VLLAVGAARECDGAARLVDEEGVARKVSHVLVDERKAARRLPCEEGVHGLDMLPLAPGRARHVRASPLG